MSLLPLFALIFRDVGLSVPGPGLQACPCGFEWSTDSTAHGLNWLLYECSRFQISDNFCHMISMMVVLIDRAGMFLLASSVVCGGVCTAGLLQPLLVPAYVQRGMSFMMAPSIQSLSLEFLQVCGASLMLDRRFLVVGA
ncbi:hypothetical protein COO60DRAFT_520051 [Scenedesmus sp. NREL 46B-D3]|nr:hypothetical protein COO60DRAFT_520051 [Scenedesmus sp. NREL 46B-D3]